MVQATIDRNIWILASDGDIQGVREFLEEGGVDVNAQDENGYSCVHAAASYGHVELLAFLVQRGGDVNLKDPDGDTPLHVCEEVATAQALVGYGADPQARNLEGKRPHDVAEEDENLELANYLRGLCGLPPVEARPEGEDFDDEANMQGGDGDGDDDDDDENGQGGQAEEEEEGPEDGAAME